MTRKIRQISESGIYHIVLRGINQQQVFEDAEDNLRLLECLKRYKSICGFSLYAYCLMGNHLHLLIKEGEVALSLVFKRVIVSFVHFYNAKYLRSGHLFQARFLSEPVEDDTYFLAVLRYIHQNPVKAMICSDPKDYHYSSYSAYLASEDTLVDTEMGLSLLGGQKEFVRFCKKVSDDTFLDYEVPARTTDEEVRTRIEAVSGCRNVSEFQALELDERNKAIKELRADGLSVRQISRLTGVSKTVVARA